MSRSTQNVVNMKFMAIRFHHNILKMHISIHYKNRKSFLNKRPTGLNGHLSIISHTGSLIFAFLSLTRLCSYVNYHLSKYAYDSYSNTQDNYHFNLTNGVVNHSKILKENHTATLMPSELDLLTPNSIEIIFDPWVVCIHVWYDDSMWKVQRWKPRNHIVTLMSSALDLWPFDPRIDKEHLRFKGNL